MPSRLTRSSAPALALALALLAACAPDPTTGPGGVAPTGNPNFRIIDGGGGSPNATFVAPDTVAEGAAFTLALTDPGFLDDPLTPSDYDYNFHCGAGTYTGFTSASSVTCAAGAPGELVVRGVVRLGTSNLFRREYVDTVVVRAAALPGQTVAFTSTPPTPALVGERYLLAATGGASGTPVVFASATPTVCTVSGSTAAFVAAGTCALTADQAGTASYAAAPQVTQIVPVSQRAQTVAFTSPVPDPAYAGTSLAVSAAATSGLGATVTSLTPTTCTVAGGTVTLVAAGGCTLAADQAGDATFSAAPRATQAFTVSAAPVAQTIRVTAAPPASAVVTRTFTLAATGGASGNAVVFTSLTRGTCTTTGANGTTLTLTAAGTCTVEATQAGNASYAAAASVRVSVTVLTPAQGVEQVRAAVAASGVKADVRQGLTDKLNAALRALAAGATGDACGALGAFQNQVSAQRGKAVAPATADAWLAQAAQLRTAVGC